MAQSRRIAAWGEEEVESSSAIEVAKHTLMSGGVLLAVGTLTGFVAQKIKVPDVALFLLVGILIGPAVLGLVNIPAGSALNQIILLFGASYILFDGGASLRFEVLKQVWITILVIATVGVLITAAITGLAAHLVFGLPVVVALLMGAALASTDPPPAFASTAPERRKSIMRRFSSGPNTSRRRSAKSSMRLSLV